MAFGNDGANLSVAGATEKSVGVWIFHGVRSRTHGADATRIIEKVGLYVVSAIGVCMLVEHEASSGGIDAFDAAVVGSDK